MVDRFSAPDPSLLVETFQSHNFLCEWLKYLYSVQEQVGSVPQGAGSTLLAYYTVAEAVEAQCHQTCVLTVGLAGRCQKEPRAYLALPSPFEIDGMFRVFNNSSFVLIPNQGNQYRYSGEASRLSCGPFWVLTQAESGHQALSGGGQSLFKDVCAHSGCVLVQDDS